MADTKISELSPVTTLDPAAIVPIVQAGVNRSATASQIGPAAAVPLALFNANTVLKADVDDTPIALTVGTSTILGRAASGGIDALTPSATRTVLGLGSLATLSTVSTTEITDGTITNGDINATAAIALSKLATDPLARANHTGTQLASTISNFDTQVRTSPLNLMAVPTGTVSMGSQSVTNVATPTNINDAATKGYVDTVAVANKTGAYTIVLADSVITADSTSAAFQVTLPTAVGNTGRQFVIKRINSGANNVTVGTTSAQTIDGATTYVLINQYQSITVVSNGSNWWII